MELKELDIETLTPEQLKPTDAERLILEPQQTITLKVLSAKAFQTDYGILWVYVGTNELGTFNFSSWGINLYPKPKAMTDIINKLVKITHTGNKRYKCEH